LTPLTRWIIRAAVAIYIVAVGYWALFAGLRLRDDTWNYTRTIHFEQDILNAWNWGGKVIDLACIMTGKDDSPQHRLTLIELMRGEGQVYQNLALGNGDDADYELDYPPMRLLTNALWVRHVRSIAPGLVKWPGRFDLTYSPTADAPTLATEDLVQPLLDMNTIAAVAAAVSAFFLVRLWVNRGGRPTDLSSINKRRGFFHPKRLIPWKPVPLSKINGLILFPICCAAFFYAVFIAESPVPIVEVKNLPDDTWLTISQWVGIAILFITMLCSMQVLPRAHRGWAAGLVAALLLWFDPSFLVDGHIYPQWDVWLVPFFILAALLASLDLWLFAGVVLGIETMFKGQMLVAGPILLAWPILSARFGAAIRLLVGYATIAGLIVSPWLVLNNHPANWSVGPLRWICSVMAAAIISGALSLYRKPLVRFAKQTWRELNAQTDNNNDPEKPFPLAELIIFAASTLIGIVLITMLVLQRWPADAGSPTKLPGLLLVLAILLLPWLLPRRVMCVWFLAILCTSIWLSSSLFHGDWSWKAVGFDYGTRKHTMMALGANSIGNLPRVLETRFGWDVHDPAYSVHPPDIAHGLHFVAAGLPVPAWMHDWGLDGTAVTLDIRQFLMGVFGLIMLLSAIGASIHSRRNHPRMLASFAAVWVLMPQVLCQMTGRYQCWASAMSVLLVGISPGLTLLHIVLSVAAAGMIAGQLLASDHMRSPAAYDLIMRFGPDDGLIMLTIGLVVLYIALAPGRRPDKEELSFHESEAARSTGTVPSHPQ
jgi:hypothetical protein